MAQGKIKFIHILLGIAALYVAGVIMTGRLMAELPGNWFTTWLGGIFSLMDDHGFFNVWSGLNQGSHYLYFIVWKPAQMIAGGEWYFSIVFSSLWFLVNTSALFLSAYFFYKIAEHIWEEQKALLIGTLYLVLFLTFNWYVVIDSLPIAALLGAIYLFFKGSGIGAGLLFGISIAIKPLAILALPLFIKSEFVSSKIRTMFTAVSLSSIAALLLPFAVANFPIFMSAFNWQSGRAPWESVYAFFMFLSDKPVPNDPVFMDYSGIAARGWGWSGITPVHSIMTTSINGYQSWYNYVFMALMILVIALLFMFKPVRTKMHLVWGTFFAMSIYFALFYGWSIQFFFWLAPFMLLLFPLAVPIGFSVIGLLEYPFFYGLYLADTAPDLATSVIGMPVSWTAALAPIGAAGYWGLIILRTVFLFALGIIAWRKLPVEFWAASINTIRVKFQNTYRVFNGSAKREFKA